MKTSFIDLQCALREQKDSKANKFISYIQMKYFDSQGHFMNVSEAINFLEAKDREEFTEIIKIL